MQSALHQTRRAKEIIVVNDSSTDSTEQVAHSFGEKIAYYKVDFRDAQKTRNFALSKASGDYLLYIDADDFLDNDALILMESAIERNSELRIVYGDRFNFGDSHRMSQAGFSYHWKTKEFSIRDLRRGNFISMPSLLRRDSFKGFDEDIRLNQDWDAWLSTLSEDSHGKHIPIPVCHVRYHSKNKTHSENELTERLKILFKHRLFLSVEPITASPLKNLGRLDDDHGTLHVILHSFDTQSNRDLTHFFHSVRKKKVIIHLVISESEKQNHFFSMKKQVLGNINWGEVAPNIESLLHALMQRGARYISNQDILVITDMSSPILNPCNLYADQPMGIIPSGMNSLKKTRKLEEISLIILNGIAVRNLLYCYEPPYKTLKLARLRFTSWISRHILWRFINKK